MKITEKEQKIISILLHTPLQQSSQIHKELLSGGQDLSLVTVKRALSEMVEKDLLVSSGSGRSVSYDVSTRGRVFFPVDPKGYCSVEPDRRYGRTTYNFDLLHEMPKEIFDEKEQLVLDEATKEYEKRTTHLSIALAQKELDRLIIELSWKSSKIEGNTYTLLDTEKLILKNKEAPGHDHKEAQMILNHKEAFIFVRKNAREFTTLTRKNLEAVHKILVKGLQVSFGLRESPSGILGSRYKPLDNIHQLREAVDALSNIIARAKNPYGKALLVLLGVSYLQPFEDGNKRTARLMTNAILLAHQMAPLSYRSVEEEAYREAILVFYELNSLMPFKEIFISQYDFAARNYAVTSLS